MLFDKIYFNTYLHKYLFNKNIVHCFGDSHARYFYQLNNMDFIKYYFNVIAIGGATAMGMANPNSKTNALIYFNKKLKTMSRNDYYVFVLGEVDCGFLIFYRAKKYNISINSQLNLSIYNYQKFLLSVKKIKRTLWY